MYEVVSPLLADIVLWIVYVMLLLAVCAAAFSVWRMLQGWRKEDAVTNGVPTVRIAWTVGAAFVACLVITFLLGSTKPVVTNGTLFADTFWLRTTDMFIYTSVILVIACSVAIIIARFRN